MKCLSCGLEAGFTRLIVNVETEEKEGSLCASCESKLERLLETAPTQETGTDQHCLECETLGRWALPEMHLSVDDDDRGDQFSYNFEIDAETPHLCTNHLEALLQESRQVDPYDMLEDKI